MQVMTAPHTKEPANPEDAYTEARSSRGKARARDSHTHSEHEGKGLDDGHESEYDADGPGGTVAKLSDESCIHQIINIGDQHADDGRD